MAQVPKGDDTRSAGDDCVRLEMRVEELERRLKARALELETEIRGKERLGARIGELTRRLSEFEETATCLHREAVAASVRSQELDEALRAAGETQRHLGSALEAECARRQAAEKDLGELRDLRRLAQAARQKIDGHEARIDSLRSEVADARRLQLEAETCRAGLESRVRDAEKRSRAVMENAGKIRRGGVEAFETAREPWQASDEIRLIRWVAICAILVAATAASVLFFQ